jgi:hypothetical protein
MPSIAPSYVQDAGAKPRRQLRLDGRTRLARRIAELKAIFADEIGERAITPMVAVLIEDAASLKAIAEQARERFARNDRSMSAEDLVRLERKASHAQDLLPVKIRGRGVPAEPSLHDYLASKATS